MARPTGKPAGKSTRAASEKSSKSGEQVTRAAKRSKKEIQQIHPQHER